MSAQSNFNESQYSYVEALKNITYDLKQNIISSGIIKPLKDIALISVGTNLWQHDILDEVKQFLYSFKTSYKGDLILEKFLDEFNNKVTEKIVKLTIPSLLRKRLEVIVTKIRKELENYFEYQPFSYLRSWNEVENLINHWENLCFTEEGKINKLKTAEIIINNSNLTTKDKYILACNNCIRDKIEDLFKEIPTSFITNITKFDVQDNVTEEYKPFRLVLFWTFYLRGENQRFVELINGASTYEFLLKWAIFHNEEVAFQYLWENFANETVKQHLIRFKGYKYDSSHCLNFHLFLSNQRTNLKPEDYLCLESSRCFVTALNRVSMSYNGELVRDYVLDFIRTHKLWDALKIIKYCWNNGFLNINTYDDIWKKFELKFEKDIKKRYSDICKFFFCFKNNKSMHHINLILRMGSFEDKIQNLLSVQGKSTCVHSLCKSLEYFVQFINGIFDSVEEISAFKSMFFTSPEFDRIFCNLALERRFNDIENILIKFCPEIEIKGLKETLPYRNDASIVYLMCAVSNEFDLLTSLDLFISWCFEENEEKINRCKAKICDLDITLYLPLKQRFFQRIDDLILKNEWNLVTKYWKWIYLATEQNILIPAIKLMRIKKILYFGSRQNLGVFLIKFITSCFSEDEIIELKENLKDSIMLFTYVRDILISNQSEMYLKLENLLDCFYSSNEDGINNFKNKLLLTYGCELFTKLIKYSSYETNSKHLYEWIKPSDESAKIFKNDVLNFIKQKESSNCASLSLTNWNILKERLTKSVELLTVFCEKRNMKMENKYTNEDNVPLNLKRTNEDEPSSNNKRVKLS